MCLVAQDTWGNFRFPEELSQSANRFGFTGYLFDPETDFYYAKARYYEPELGRFLTQDSFLGDVDAPPSLHRYAYASNNPLVFIDPDGNESVRQAWGIEEPQGFWSAFGKNLAYNTWNAISFGTLGRQDTLVEQYESGAISDEQYWGRTAINAGSSAAVAVAAAATGGAAAGVAAGLGAGATATGIVAGAAAGVAAQATTDVIEVAGTQTKRLEDVRASDYLFAAAAGGFSGGVAGRAAANPGAVRFNLNPNVRGLSALDDTFVQRGAQSVQNAIAGVAQRSTQAGRQAVTVVESAPPPKAPPSSSPNPRMRAIREALSDSKGRLLPKAERPGIKSAIRNVEAEGYELTGSIKYRGNQGIDLSFRGTGSNAGRFALAEAKSGGSRGSLVRDSLGIRQGGREFARTRLARGIVYGDPAKRNLYRQFYRDLRGGKVDLFANFAETDRLFQLDPVLFNRDVNFLTTPKASVRLK